MQGIPTRCTMVSVVTVRGAGEAARTLLLRRARAHLHGLWVYAAGHIEPGEKAWQTAARELAEETGLRPTALYSADRCETYYDATEECIAVVPAFVAFVDADAAVRLDAEHDDHAWLSFPEAIARLPFGGQRSLFAHVQREFVLRPPSPVLRMPPGGSDGAGRAPVEPTRG
ncbi:NUDIX hydrolase [Fulvimonas yonginensis]|uniref:NUDIX domain-containing protein n=1 Tax=Fulvimonas yonginensis TaxID=1495200 RepID=A0ABU8JDI1_9GAMM